MLAASLYMQYLVADQITKRIERLGGEPGSVFFTGGEVHVSLGYNGQGIGRWSPAEAREQLVADFLTAHPDATLDRSPNDLYVNGKPQMTVRGESTLGIRWQVDFGDGVCERVQVGTKTVEQYDSDALLALPKVTVEEPIFEYRCPDPITTAGLIGGTK